MSDSRAAQVGGRVDVMSAAGRLAPIVLFACLTAAGSLIWIPFRPFQPTTLQVFFVLLSGGLLGKYRGALSQMLYGALGLAGVPYFSALTVAFPQPNFFAHQDFIMVWIKVGYLAGFVAAAYVAGKTMESKDNRYGEIFVLMLAAALVVYVAGLAYFVAVGVPIRPRFVGGVLLFASLDAVKVFFASAVVYRLRKEAAV